MPQRRNRNIEDGILSNYTTSLRERATLYTLPLIGMTHIGVMTILNDTRGVNTKIPRSLLGDQFTSYSIALMVEQVKLCRKCSEVKPIAEFGSDAQKVDGKCWWYKDCMREAYLKRQELRKIGRNATLAKFTNEELLNELKFRLWQEEAVIR